MSKNSKDVGITGYLEKEEFDMLEEIRWRERKSRAEILRLAIHEYIKAHGNGNSTFKLDNWTDNPEFRAVPTIMSDSETWENYLRTCGPEELRDLKVRTGWVKAKCEELV